MTFWVDVCWCWSFLTMISVPATASVAWAVGDAGHSSAILS